jgi:ankyrin repeat protein
MRYFARASGRRALFQKRKCMDIISAVKSNDINKVNANLNVQNINEKDKNGMTPLMLAIDENNLKIVEILLMNKAGVDLMDKYNQTALMLAAGRGNIQIVKLLIKYHANTKIKAKNGLTAYNFALENGRKEIAEYLKNK